MLSGNVEVGTLRNGGVFGIPVPSGASAIDVKIVNRNSTSPLDFNATITATTTYAAVSFSIPIGYEVEGISVLPFGSSSATCSFYALIGTFHIGTANNPIQIPGNFAYERHYQPGANPLITNNTLIVYVEASASMNVSVIITGKVSV